MPRFRHLWLLAAIVLVGVWAWPRVSQDRALQGVGTTVPPNTRPAGRAYPPLLPRSASTRGPAANYPAMLPREAHAVLDSIARGGPYDHRQDGNVFQNREHRLPPQAHGYYREFTVPTPGSPDRGPRRIVTGGDPPESYWYSDDHYRSFRRFDPGTGGEQ